tara:strand:+ start:184 stop:498 length:315 start_codon:yes stop_codon:yes gene_type:complete
MFRIFSISQQAQADREAERAHELAISRSSKTAYDVWERAAYSIERAQGYRQMADNSPWWRPIMKARLRGQARRCEKLASMLHEIASDLPGYIAEPRLWKAKRLH